MTITSRRSVLAGVGTAALGLATARASATSDDEAFWRGIAAEYDVTRDVIQLENGNYGMMARPVAAAYREHVARVNRDTSFYTRRGFAADALAARALMAEEMGVPDHEIAFTRNATEALKALILGYNRLRPGDAVVYADLDYDSMQACMEALARRSSASVIRIALPEPATRQSLLDAYAEAFARHPRIRLVLVTHLSHRTGLVLPVREIGAMARARGVDAIVDAAHSWGQLDGDLADLDADFVGVNGHKWLGAPIGVGALHIRTAALAKIDYDPANLAGDRNTVGARVHPGTSDFAAVLTVPDAIAFQRRIGRSRRAARLAALRNRWVDAVRDVPGIEILTPNDPALHGGIISFRFTGVTSSAGNAALAQRLLERHGIFTVHREGPAKGACIRVTPALFTRPAEMDRLAAALKAERAAG